MTITYPTIIDQIKEVNKKYDDMLQFVKERCEPLKDLYCTKVKTKVKTWWFHNKYIDKTIPLEVTYEVQRQGRPNGYPSCVCVYITFYRFENGDIIDHTFLEVTEMAAKDKLIFREEFINKIISVGENYKKETL